MDVQRKTNDPHRMSDRDKSALEQFDTLPDAANVASPVVEALIGAHRATLWRWVKAGRLPAPTKLGPQMVRWNVGALRQYLRTQREAA